jgi:hypothetical protein
VGNRFVLLEFVVTKCSPWRQPRKQKDFNSQWPSQIKCDTYCITMKTHSTEKAAELIGITRITLQRWLAKALVRPSIAIPMRGKTLWRWTPEDVRRAKQLRGTFKPGPKSKAAK